MRSLLARAFLFLAILLTPLSVHAQETGTQETGSVAGTLVDSETGDPLIGANVQALGTSTGAATDVTGRYRIEGLKPGTHELAYSYVGYQTRTITGVKITAGEITTLDVQLAPANVKIDEVTVEARLVRNNEAALLKDRQKAAALSNAVSARSMSRSGAGDAAEAMEQVTGASVVDGKYVQVRGLGDRYVNTQLNGAEMPSADPDENAVPLDLFPADLLKNVVTSKTFTPDQPGNFTGGNVNISTKSFPSELSVSFSASTKYNTAISPRGSYLSFPNGGVGRFGLRSDDFALPDLLKQRSGFTIPTKDAAASNAGKADTLDMASNAFSSVMSSSQATAPINQSYDLSVGNQVDVLGRPLGFVGSLTYSRETSGYKEGTAGQYYLAAGSNPALTSRYSIRDERVGTQKVLWGGLASLSYKPHPRHELSLTYMHNHSAESAARFQTGRLAQQAGTWRNQAISYVERTIQSLQAKGKHAFGSQDGVRLNWTSSLSRTKQREPDRRYFSSLATVDGQARDTTYEMSAAIGLVPQRYFRNMKEDGWSNKLGVTVPFEQWSGQSAELKVGGAYNTKNRRFDERRFLIRPNFDEAPYQGSVQRFYASQNVGLVDTSRFGGYKTFFFANYPEEQPGTAYDADQQIAAGFGMVDLPLASRLRFIGGARFERTDMFVRETQIDSTGSLNANTWLPSANLLYQLSDGMNLRAAFSRTLARPSFCEFAPYSSFAFLRGYITIGNPDLKLTRTANYDLRWEWFTGPDEIVAVSGFYKRFQNPIERVLLTENGQIQHQNVNDATVYGAEFEVRQNLGVVAGWLRHVQAGGNLTLTESSVDIAQEELATIRKYKDDPATTRSLQDQSPYVVNAHLSYSNPNTGTEVGTYFHRFGERLAGVARGGTPNPREQPRNVLDLTAQQRIGNGFSLKLSATNLLDSPHRVTYAYRSTGHVSKEYRKGRTFSLGFKYSL